MNVCTLPFEREKAVVAHHGPEQIDPQGHGGRRPVDVQFLDLRRQKRIDGEVVEIPVVVDVEPDNPTGVGDPVLVAAGRGVGPRVGPVEIEELVATRRGGAEDRDVRRKQRTVFQDFDAQDTVGTPASGLHETFLQRAVRRRRTAR
jgi:hypothetical protein